MRNVPTLALGERPRRVRVTTPQVARTVGSMAPGPRSLSLASMAGSFSACTSAAKGSKENGPA